MQTLIFFAILASVALAAPTPRQSSGTHSSFTIPRTRNTGYVRDGSKAMSRAFRKFGWQMSIPIESSSSITWMNSSDSASSTEADDGFANFVKVASATASSASSTTTASGSEESGEVAATPADDGAEYLSKVS